jgi:hypothetical protein
MSWTSSVRSAAAGVAFLAVAGASSFASAVSFTGSYTVDALSSDPGLVIQTAELADQLNFVLDSAGDMYTVDLFKIWTDETFINPDDRIEAGISVDFDFTAPLSSGSVNGTTGGGSVLIFSGGRVEWNGPSVIDFGNGGALKISLSDEIFNVGLFGNTWPGWKHGATVKAQFELVSESVEVVEAIPLPASLPLFAAALAGLGLLRRRTRAEA